ncbi:pyridoxamine 5'-phosphate oxidase [Polluticoccus soli]|uniref:pyridoxamine 5'-phosphate oxidase n=1 Tax=Polluticoccus soli TaxID=3034150 RepID=UPI0023E183C1|nr:pyridoxamine 5'-phosphate oxidase [Flavipsychrobacter sp. JY13-12]
MSNRNIADIRKDYQMAELDEATAGGDPFAFFGKWFAEAEAAQAEEVNAMVLATVDLHNKPHARIVLLKGLDEKGFVFFTNYSSAKGLEIESNPFVALVFFWTELERQVRIEGRIEKISEEESDHYFSTRPDGSKIGAWSSPQSQSIPDRSILENNYKQYADQFGNDIPRPPHWGGYRVIPHYIEFWQGRSSRMHDRIVFSEDAMGEWVKTRLAP